MTKERDRAGRAEVRACSWPTLSIGPAGRFLAAFLTGALAVTGPLSVPPFEDDLESGRPASAAQSLDSSLATRLSAPQAAPFR